MWPGETNAHRRIRLIDLSIRLSLTPFRTLFAHAAALTDEPSVRNSPKHIDSSLVRKGGLEPPRYCYRQPLKLVRLPIPPLPRGGMVTSPGSLPAVLVLPAPVPGSAAESLGAAPPAHVPARGHHSPIPARAGRRCRAPARRRRTARRRQSSRATAPWRRSAHRTPPDSSHRRTRWQYRRPCPAAAG